MIIAKIIKTDRLERVITAAVKQSLKTFHPVIDELVDFNTLINTPFKGQKFIAYIHPEVNLELHQAYKKGDNALILIGPEGDFSAGEVEAAKEKGHRIVAVGTTVVRALEAYASTGEKFGNTDIFIYPPYEFKIVDSLITNFHLPRSTLLMLVCAFAGYDLTMRAYRIAVEKNYRFYSFGDAMLILRG